MARGQRKTTAAVALMPSNGVFVPEFCKMTEVRIENKKFLLPMRLTGAETPNKRATNFYTTVAKLEQAAWEIPPAQGLPIWQTIAIYLCRISL